MSETKRHLEARTTLYLLLKEALAATAAVGSDQFVYADASNPQKCLSPDVFVKLGAREESFDTWKVWERGAPEIAVEIVSDSDRGDAEWAAKLTRYQASGIGEVVRFDPDDEEEPLRVWDRVEGDLVERASSSPVLRECAALRLWWVVVPSPYGPLLRLARDRDGKAILPTPSETSVRLEQQLAEERRARSLAEHERMLAQHERTLARQAQERAEQAQRLAEEKLLAEQETRREAEAEAERLRAELRRLRGEG